MRRLFVFPLLIAVGSVVSGACSANDSAGTTNNGGGFGGGGAGDSGLTCGYCVASQFYPCVNGQPGPPEFCPVACATGIGCSDCVPGSTVCVGNEVQKCGDDGKANGEVVETCDIAGGELCGNGQCGTACEIAEGQASNVGCEFWAVDLDQIDGDPLGIVSDPSAAPWGVVLSNAGQSQANVTIEMNEAPQGQPPQPVVVTQVTLQATSLEQIILPTREVDCGLKPDDYAAPGTCLSSQAFRITSSAPIIVYQFNVFENAYSNDASLLIPTHSLGKVHRVIGWGAGHPFLPVAIPGIGVDRSYVTVVGTQPGTQVTVSPKWRIKGNPPIAPTPAGGTITATIGPFDVLNLETDDGTAADDPATMADLSGTSVVASAPVAVFSGVESTAAPGPVDVPEPPGGADTCCLDHLEEQVFPAEAVGKNYVITRSPVRSTGSWKEPDVIRFLGVAEVAQVTTTLPAPFDSFTLQPGEVRTTWTQENFTVVSTTPVSVGQILVSQGYVDGPFIGDPSLTIYPPVEQYRTEYVILTPGSWTENWVVISARAGEEVVLDGTSTLGCKTDPAGSIEGIAYESRVCPLVQGVHVLNGPSPFGIVAYGYGAAGSYAFVGGADIKKIYEPPPIE
jgi:hypothetical protein